jgi:uncharacterized membrane protein
MNALGIQLDRNVGTTGRILSAIAGGLLLLHGIRKGRKLSEIPLGSFLLFRGATGYCPVTQAVTKNGAVSHPHTVDINTSVLINKPREEVYSFWRKLENLPRFMKHLESVTVIDEKTSFWKAKVPGGIATIDWESEITMDRPNEQISWQSLPESEIRNSGMVTFKDAGVNKTELQARISYDAPGGVIGESVAKLLNPLFAKMVKSEIESIKDHFESKKKPAKQSFK